MLLGTFIETTWGFILKAFARELLFLRERVGSFHSSNVPDLCFCRRDYNATSLWHVSPMYYCFNHSTTVYDPTNLAAMSAGHQINAELWPTNATWSNDPNDSGVYCATTPAFDIIHTLTHHAAIIVMAASEEYQLPGLAIYEITPHHPQYNTFQNRANPNFFIYNNYIQ